MVGQSVSHYQIVEKIGEGGMGEVYKARDPRLQRFVALKVLPRGLDADSTARQRFLREAQAASALNHPSIVTIYDLISQPDADYLVMEYLDGCPLSNLIAKGGMPMGQALHYAIEAASALQAAHEAQIVHRDIKPSNVFVMQRGHVKILDFGVAKLSRETEDKDATRSMDLTETGSFLGTPLYAAPEQLMAEPHDWRTDIFSFGVMLYEMLTGDRPFQGGSRFAILNEVVSGKPRRLRETHPHLPQELDDLVFQMLARHKENRPASMNEVAVRLSAISTGGTTALAMTQMMRAAVQVPSTGSGKPLTSPPAQGSERISIAVLPLRSLSPDPDDAMMADGLAYEITSALTSVPGLRVAPHLSAFRYKNQVEDLETVSRGLKCRYVLTGSMRRAGSRIRVIAELADATESRVLWTQKYDRAVEDLFALQDEITGRIVGATGGQLRRLTMEQYSHQPAERLDAWELTRKAFHFWNHEFRLEGVNEALGLLRRAVEIDPRYALAHAYLGLYLIQRVVGFISDRPMEDAAEALECAEKAIRLAPNDAETLENCGLIWFLSGEYERSVRSLRKAVGAAPYNLVAWGYLGLAMAWGGGPEQLTEARKILTQLISDTPDHPSYPYWHYFLYAVNLREGRYAEALANAQTTLEVHPMYILARVAMSNVLGLMGRVDEARAAFSETLAINPYFSRDAYVPAVLSACHHDAGIAEEFLRGLRVAGLLD